MDKLVFQRMLPHGRVLAMNVWPGGWQMLVYQSRKDFEEAKVQVEQKDRVPDPISYAPIKETA